MKDNTKNIDKFIKQNLKIEETSLNFSSNVMEQIYAVDLKKKKALSSLMQKHVIEEPSINFTSNVLSTIEQKSKVSVYQPVIGKKAWIFIGSLIIFIFVYALFNIGSPAQNSIIDNFFLKIHDYFSFEFPSISISPLFTLSIFALSSLLCLDYFLRNRRLS